MPDALGHLLLCLPALVDEAREVGLPVVLERAEPLPAHAQRLMDTLGVEVRIVTSTRQIQSGQRTRGRSMGHYTQPGETPSNGDGPRADWIDFRASLSRIYKRRDAGETPRICAHCGTELDVADVVHSPKCPVMFAGEQKPASEWDQNAAITAIRLWADEHDGQPPSSEDWRRARPGYPTYPVVVRLFGSWNDGIAAAGLEPRPSHRDPEPSPEPRGLAQEENIVNCKIEGCDNEAADHKPRSPFSRLCDTHTEASRARLAATTAARRATETAAKKPTPAPVAAKPSTNGHVAGVADRARQLVALAERVDEVRAALVDAEAELAAAAQEFANA